jgi:hypothetical protein
MRAPAGRPVDPRALVTDERIEMTDWELHDMAVQVVREHLQQQGFELMSWQGNPEVDPSIWFIGKSGRNGSSSAQRCSRKKSPSGPATGRTSPEVART